MGPAAGLHAFSRDGDLRWQFGVGGEDVGSSPVVADETVFFASDDGIVYEVE